MTSREPDRLGPQPDGTIAGYGHRYLLPVHCAYDATTDDGVEPFRYSFLSLARSDGPPGLLAGEYGHGGMTTRLLTHPFDEATDLLTADEDGISVPLLLEHGGVPRMQGVVAALGKLYVTSSRGRYRLGSLYVGRPGHLREVSDALPVGPEDVCHWPSRGQLWSLTEYPRQRLVFTVDLDQVSRER